MDKTAKHCGDVKTAEKAVSKCRFRLVKVI